VTTIGYARVSTASQDLSLQIKDLREHGCDRVNSEKMSGYKRQNRPIMEKMLKALNPGDVVLVTRLDRIARSSRDLHNIIHQITEAGASFKSLADSWCDTTTPHGRLILAIMGGLAEFERELIMARTQAGIERARERGVKFGRRERLNTTQRKMLAERYAAGETMAGLADFFEVGVATVFRALRTKEVV